MRFAGLTFSRHRRHWACESRRLASRLMRRPVGGLAGHLVGKIAGAKNWLTSGAPLVGGAVVEATGLRLDAYFSAPEVGG